MIRIVKIHLTHKPVDTFQLHPEFVQQSFLPVTNLLLFMRTGSWSLLVQDGTAP